MSTTLGAWLEIKAVDAFSSSTRPTYPSPPPPLPPCSTITQSLSIIVLRTTHLQTTNLDTFISQ